MLEGKLDDFSLPDIFQLITLTKKSGALRITSGQQEGRVLFKGGEVCFAVSDVRRLAMGARLVAAGLVDEDQLMNVLEAQKSGGSGSVLQALLEEAVVDEEALDTFVREQVEDAVFDLLRLTEASFVFDAAEEEGDSPVGMSVATEHLIIEGSRRLGEWAAIRERIPSSDAVLELSPAAVGTDGTVSVPADQWRVMALVDGKRTVAEIVDLNGQGEFVTCQVLCNLASAGLVEVTDPSTGSSGALSQLVERRDLLRRLEEMELGGSAKPVVEPASPAVESPKPGVIPPAEPAVPQPEPKVETPKQESKPEPKPAPVAETTPAPVAEPKPEPKPEPEPVQESPQVPAEPAAQAKPAGEAGQVDRSQVARELASLGLGDVTGPSPKAAQTNGSSNGSSNGRSPNGSAPAEPEPVRKLTRDEDVNKGLLLRLIDGVKGA